MKFKLPTRIQVMSPNPMFDKQDMIRAMRTHLALAPYLIPEKWGWTEPRTVFDPDNVEQIIPHVSDELWESNMKWLEKRRSLGDEVFYAPRGQADSVHWKRSKKPKAEGSLGVGWINEFPHNNMLHSDMGFNCEFGQIDQEHHIHYLKQFSIAFDAHFSMLDVVTPYYADFGRKSGAALYGDLYITTHELRHWLPDIFWGTVLGPPYVALLGKDRLLSAPVAVAEEIAPDMIYIQLTADFSDAVADPEGLMAKRQMFKDHVGVKAFYEESCGFVRYDFGDREIPFDLFETPDFNLIAE